MILDVGSMTGELFLPHKDKPSRLVRGVWERLRVFKHPERAAQHLRIG